MPPHRQGNRPRGVWPLTFLGIGQAHRERVRSGPTGRGQITDPEDRGVAPPGRGGRGARGLDCEKVLPVGAEVGDNIGGDASLPRRKAGWTSHVGKVRIVVDKDYRGKGLGTRMIEELIDFAKKAGLELLVAEVLGNQKTALAAFKHLGFEKEAILYNHVKDQAGKEHNLAVMIKNLLVEPAPVVF